MYLWLFEDGETRLTTTATDEECQEMYENTDGNVFQISQVGSTIVVKQYEDGEWNELVLELGLDY